MQRPAVDPKTSTQVMAFCGNGGVRISRDRDFVSGDLRARGDETVDASIKKGENELSSTTGWLQRGTVTAGAPTQANVAGSEGRGGPKKPKYDRWRRGSREAASTWTKTCGQNVVFRAYE
ncbi:hypothetical protein BHE74_00052293 [Ensete ventricosum]|nr:hypothetical protein GW17_00019425 [Ensete ventricosum]RWW42178.1 hypothetical protein BHE74_00052293 [Ensete ventricosum]